jgi:beta-lactam-binding protein with PASTA domain
VISMRSLFVYTLYAGIFLAVVVGAGFITANLIVKSGKEIQIPDVTGMEVVDALETLSQAGLSMKVDEFEYSATIRRNAVLRQEPKPGDRLKTGSAIRIVLSRGKEKIRVPDLVGMSRRQAEIVLARDGLLTGHISETHSLTTEQGQVLSQQPEPSSLIYRESPVNMLVSLGARPARYIMPDLLGRPQGQAVVTLERMKLKIGEISSRYQPQLPPGLVLEQAPRAGNAVDEGDVVTLVVQSEGDEGRDSSRLALVRYMLPPGFLRSRVEVKLQRGKIAVTVFQQFVDPGEPVDVLIVLDHESKVLLSVDGRELKARQFVLQEFDNAG